MTDFTVNVEGLAEIQRKLKLLPERLGNRALRRALRRGANVVRDAARNNAKRIDDPKTREMIWKNIVTQGAGRRRERAAGGVMMRVGVLGGAKERRSGFKRTGQTYKVGGSSSNPGGDTFHWRFLEFGTSKMRAQPFMRPAASTAAPEVFSAFAQAASVELDKELAKIR